MAKILPADEQTKSLEIIEELLLQVRDINTFLDSKGTFKLSCEGGKKTIVIDEAYQKTVSDILTRMKDSRVRKITSESKKSRIALDEDEARIIA